MSTDIDRRHLSWAECASLTCTLADMVRESGPVDTVMAVSRGGLVPGALMATLLDMRDVVSTAIASYEDEERVSGPNFVHFPDNGKVAGRSVLIVDDVWDTGHTAVAVADRVRQAGGRPIVAVLHYKPSNSQFPDRKPELWVEETTDWIVYPWEREALDGYGGTGAGETGAGAGTGTGEKAMSTEASVPAVAADPTVASDSAVMGETVAPVVEAG